MYGSVKNREIVDIVLLPITQSRPGRQGSGGREKQHARSENSLYPTTGKIDEGRKFPVSTPKLLTCPP